MRSFIGDFGEKDGSMHILNGDKTVISNHFDTVTTEFLGHFQNPVINGHQIPMLSSDIKENDFVNLMKKTRENTSSSPSGLHMGHYNAGACMKDVPFILTTMLYLPFQYGFSPKRWQASIHVMLEKVQGQTRIYKLRIIQLLEADFNISLKIKLDGNS